MPQKIVYHNTSNHTVAVFVILKYVQDGAARCPTPGRNLTLPALVCASSRVVSASGSEMSVSRSTPTSTIIYDAYTSIKKIKIKKLVCAGGYFTLDLSGVKFLSICRNNWKKKSPSAVLPLPPTVFPPPLRQIPAYVTPYWYYCFYISVYQILPRVRKSCSVTF